eukprot:gnl/MRDRNA2_/MRDRNA2_84452_c0_seq1.p1 gnl/MRDRNA2_/MRDRNA2_84452_c0~~gnl/MRDRNA2_/MRDRNA2_84452_c0_seq1.p1  ORF type:complete len:282 (+),score=45.36 gnl/MRDRNA2_/MRDRNA2_84452_c0_seq1:136-981(+)
MLRPLLFGLICASVAKGLKISPDPSQSTIKAKAHVFVLNAANKTGRCRCASGQLAESGIPYSVSRVNAATPDTASELCKDVKNVMDTPHQGPEAALFCSNYLAWKEALENHADKDYIIVFEDDVFLEDKGNFWQKVDDFLASNCTNWDHITVDPYGYDFGPSKAHKDCPDFRLRKPSIFGGAHMQMLRVSSLQDIVTYVNKHGSYIMDDVGQWMPNHMMKLVWKPHIVRQISPPGGKQLNTKNIPEYCTHEVFKHTVTMPVHFGWGWKQQESEMQAFPCEN